MTGFAAMRGAFSDAEAAWPDEVKARMRRDGMAVVMANLTLWQKLRFFIAFARERRRAMAMDVSDLVANGLTNARFLATQRDYLALFAALARVLGTPEAVRVCKAIMDATAVEPMRMLLPDAEALASTPDVFVAFREVFAAQPEAARRAGSQTLAFVDEGDTTGFDVTWCVWLELAQRMGVPEACLPNCYADELVFPDYFAAIDIRYARSETLASGGCRCDFRFHRGCRRDGTAGTPQG